LSPSGARERHARRRRRRAARPRQVFFRARFCGTVGFLVSMLPFLLIVSAVAIYFLAF
jgi:hypothetical protein